MGKFPRGKIRRCPLGQLSHYWRGVFTDSRLLPLRREPFATQKSAGMKAKAVGEESMNSCRREEKFSQVVHYGRRKENHPGLPR